jgi:hypothetical protein
MSKLQRKTEVFGKSASYRKKPSLQAKSEKIADSESAYDRFRGELITASEFAISLRMPSSPKTQRKVERMKKRYLKNKSICSFVLTSCFVMASVSLSAVNAGGPDKHDQERGSDKEVYGQATPGRS